MTDILVLAELNHTQYGEVTELWELTGVGNPARGDTFEAVMHTLSNGGRLIIVYQDSTAVGTVWLTHDYRRAYIHHMAVRPSHQNKGYGKLLLEEALKIAGELNLQAKLEVHKDNTIAYELYNSYGFKTLDGYLTMIKRDI